MAKKRAYKKSPIVTGYLEKVRSSIFGRYRDAITAMTKSKQGLYALYRKDKLHYVGLASNLRGRINNHLKDRLKGKWTHFSLYIIRHEDHIKELESLLLRIASPEGNRVKGSLRRSANMLPVLKRMTKAAAVKEWKAVFETGVPGAKTGKAKKGKSQLKSWETRRKQAERPARGLFSGNKRIYASYKGKEYKGWVFKNGAVKFDGKRYDTPTAAAKVIVDIRTCNGWSFWRVKDASGKMVKLSKFRK